MRSRYRTALVALLLAAVAIAVLVLRDTDQVAAPAPMPTPKPGITVKAGEIKTAPQVGAPTREKAVKAISAALKSLFSRAYEQPQATPGPDETPRPKPAVRVRPSLTQIARTALAKQPEIFDEASDLTVYTATLTYSGVITFDGKSPLEALLEIDFGGEAVPVGALSPQAKVRQTGTVILKNTDKGWLVDGYELDLVTRPLQTSTPEPD